jgi:hypothetical protein
VPELSVSEPLTPLDTAFDDDTLTSPVDALVLAPDVITTLPPDLLVVVAFPAVMDSSPPSFKSDAPTCSEIAPPLPDTAFPEERMMSPVSPDAVVPDRRMIEPLRPINPAPGEPSVMSPLDVEYDAPLTIDTAPPNLAVLTAEPALSWT